MAIGMAIVLRRAWATPWEAAVWIGGLFCPLAAAIAGAETIWNDLYAFGRVLSPLYILPFLFWIEERKGVGWLPLALLYPRFVIELAARYRLAA